MGDVRGQRGGARVNDRAHQLSPIQENSIWRSATGARRGATASRRTRRSTTASSPCPSRSTTTSPSAPSPRVARRTQFAPRPRPRTRGPSQAAEERDTRALRAPAATWEAAHARQVALDEAYVYYKRFGKLALDTIPSHNYYKDPRYKDDKKQLKANCVKSLAKLESLVGVMDGDEALLAAEGEKVRALEAKRRAAEARAAEIARLAAEKRAREDAAAAAVPPRSPLAARNAPPPAASADIARRLERFKKRLGAMNAKPVPDRQERVRRESFVAKGDLESRRAAVDLRLRFRPSDEDLRRANICHFHRQWHL